MKDYNSYDEVIGNILKILGKEKLEKEDFKKSLELIIQLRTDLIQSSDILKWKYLRKYNFKLEQLDKLYTNKFDEGRIETFQNIVYKDKK